MTDGVTVLVADDEDEFRKILALELQGEGYRVDTAADGAEAMKMLEQKRYDVILLDIRMPHVNGFEILRFVKKKFPETKVIMLTAFSDMAYAIESKNLGAQAFLSKPYDLMKLFTTIRQVLATNVA